MRGCLLFVASSPDYFVEGFPEWHFDAQWSPGLANSLSRDVISGAESQYGIRRGSRLPCLCCVVYGGASRLTVGPCRP